MQDKTVLSIHWSQWLCPGPRRVFTAEEMARAGQQPWPKAIDGYVLSNVVILLAINYNQMARSLAAIVCAAFLIGAWLALRVAKALWRKPTRWRLNLATVAVTLLLILLALGLRWLDVDRAQREVPMLILLTSVLVTLTSWWFLTVYRVQQIEARLREVAMQEQGLKLARRLATAQIQPHFLFNTLASLQHWVDTHDARAGTTLRSFTQYLRATLPMFERETLSLVEELQIVRSYLAVMQARLGARLTWTVDAPPALDGLLLPPGVLLTLVENAIAHGIEPALAGGQIRVDVQKIGTLLRLDVADDGAGLADSCTDGVGLANTRARLQQQFGARARLSLSALRPGCLARIEIDEEVAA
ncbi:hypothetical protein BH11PSE10_BH11PSE10_07880 [soil metagenome]